MDKSHFIRDWYSEFGKEKLGPFLYAYTDWLYQKIVSDNIKNVYFFARDGYLMKKAFDIYLDYHHSIIKTRYVYFSRKSIRQAMLWKTDSYEESLKYMSTSRYISIGGILEYYGFSNNERIEIAEKYGLVLDEEFLTHALSSNSKIKNLYLSLKDKIHENSYSQYRLLKEYIRQIELTQNSAIVDIGWYGRMQWYFEQFLELCGIEIKVIGYYLGICPSVPLKGKADGFLYDETNLKLKKKIQTFLGGYEKLFQSQEGSTYGYKEENGRIFPILGKYEYENNKNSVKYITAWQDSAVDYVKTALDKGIKPSKGMVRPLIRLGVNPTVKDVKMLSFLCNDDGKESFFVSQKPIWRYKPKEFIHSLSNSAWKTGFMKSAFRVPFPYYYIYCLFKR